MTTFRNPNKDSLKSSSILKEQTQLHLRCRLEDCDELLTIFDGPGSDSYCRHHQLMLTDYEGGMGKADRPHTFYREWVCEDCGYDPRTDPYFDDYEDPFHKASSMRAMLEGDHQQLASDNGANTKENVHTRCVMCHRKKTMRNKDYLGKRKNG
jgi:hypothetical protein